MTTDHEIDPGLAQLIANHPALFHGGPPRSGSYCRPGWLPIVDTLCTDLEQLLGPGGCDLFRWLQIKEKFGSLRLYFSFGPRDADGEVMPHPLMPEVRRLVDAAVGSADETCEECGARGELRADLGWHLTLCDAHYEEARKRQPAPTPRVVGTLMVVYLCFDSVLHPRRVVFNDRVPELQAPGHRLFENVPILEDLLRPYPYAKLVLATPWVRRLGYSRCRDFLGPELAERCVGSIYHSRMRHTPVESLDVPTLVKQDAWQRRPEVCVGIDSDPVGWPQSILVVSDEMNGIGEPSVRDALAGKLSVMAEHVAKLIQPGEGS